MDTTNRCSVCLKDGRLPFPVTSVGGVESACSRVWTAPVSSTYNTHNVVACVYMSPLPLTHWVSTAALSCLVMPMQAGGLWD